MIFFEGWLSKASADSNRWRRRYFRVRDGKLEYLQVGDGAVVEDGAQHAPKASFSHLLSSALGSAAAAAGVSSSHGAGNDEVASDVPSIPTLTITNARPGDESEEGDQEEPFEAASPRHKPNTPTSWSGHVSIEKDYAQGAGKALRNVAKEVGEAPRGGVNLHDASLLVLGNEKEGGFIGQIVSQDSVKHALFHEGKPMLLVLGRPGKPTWRLADCESSQGTLARLVGVLERAVPRTRVLAAGWISTPGTINWNRRYALLESTGNLFIFKDPSLENLRREMWLGESGCEIEALRKPSALGSNEEQADIAGLGRSYTKKNGGFIDNAAISVMHPTIPDKKGYRLSVERLHGNETPSLHLGRLREWLRLLQSARLYASTNFRDQVTFQRDRVHLAQVRDSHHSREILETLIESASVNGSLSPDPTIVELGRAGFPPTLRGKVWHLLCVGNIDREPQKKTRAAKIRRTRSFSFAFPLKDCFTPEQWHVLALASSDDETNPQIRGILFSVLDNVNGLSYSKELLSTVKFVARIATSTSTAVSILSALFGSAFLQYHTNSGKAKASLDPLFRQCSASSPKSLSADIEPALPRTSPSKERATAYYSSLALYVDSILVLELVSILMPRLEKKFVTASLEIVSTWLAGLFTYAVPFNPSCTARVWDLLVSHLDDCDTTKSRDQAVRVAVATFSLVATQLEKCSNMDEWQRCLSVPTEGATDDQRPADWLVYKVSRDRSFLHASSWNRLRERRVVYWNSLETQAKQRCDRVDEWLKSAQAMEGAVSQLNSALDHAASKSWELGEREPISTLVRPLHQKAILFSSALAVLTEALELVQSTLNHVSYVKHFPTSQLTPCQDLELTIDEASSSSVRLLGGGQVAINPMTVIQVIRLALALGWELVAASEKCIAVADIAAYGTLSMYAKSVTSLAQTEPIANNSPKAGSLYSPRSPDVSNRPIQALRSADSATPASEREKHTYCASLAGLVEVLRPPGDPKPSKVRRLGQFMEHKFHKVLCAILEQLDSFTRCIINTSLDQQQRATANSNSVLDPKLPGDIFGGQMHTLSQIVPFVLKSAEEIKEQGQEQSQKSPRLAMDPEDRGN